MNCRESRQLIEAWADHELSERDAESFESHMRGCAACRSLAQAQAAFVQGLREKLPRRPMPADMRARLLALASSRRAPARLPTLWGRLAAAGAMVAVACLLLFAAGRRAEADSWTQFYLDEHGAHSAGPSSLQYRAASPEKLAAWFNTALKRKMHIPQMPGAQLLGGRICLLRGQQVGLAIYEVRGQTLSLFMGDERVLCPHGWRGSAGETFTLRAQGLSLAAWERGDHFHVAVSALGLPQLEALAKQCQASI